MAEIVRFDAGRHSRCFEKLARLHIEVIEHDRVAMTFLPPFNFERMVQYWEGLALKSTGAANTLLLCVDSVPDSSSKTNKSDSGPEELIGCVLLESQQSETRPSVAGVAKLMVSPKHRGKDIARRLMAELEGVAVQEGRHILVS